MPTTKSKTRNAIAATPAPDFLQAYVARGLDLDWVVKRLVDGKLISKAAEKTDAKKAAEDLGFLIC